MFDNYSHLIIDEMNLCHRLYATSKHLSWNGEPTGLIYSMLRSLISFYKKGFQGCIYICSDSQTTWKKEAGLGYKADRQSAVLGDFWTQINELRKILSHSSKIIYVSADKFEADDCAYTLLYRDDDCIVPHEGKKVLLHTQDSDWYYFTKRGDVDIFDGKKILTKTIIEEKHSPVPVDKIVLFNALNGCSHNNVRSVFDAPKAKEIVMQIDNIVNIKLGSEYAEVADKIMDNYFLVRPMLCEVEMLSLKHPSAKDIIRAAMEKYGIKSLIEFAELIA